MIKLIRSLGSLLCLGLLAMTLAIAIPAIAQPPVVVKPAMEQPNRSSSLNNLDRGLAAYQAGRYTDAIDAWQQAEQEYRKQGDRALQASTLNYLSLAHQELGQWQQAKKDITQSLKILQGQPELIEENSALLAQALNAKGKLQLASGESEAALETWQQAASNYKKARDEMGVIGSQINQAQALQTLGFHRRSQKMLEQIQQQLERQSDPLLKALGFRSLGTTLQTIGNLDRAREILQKSLDLSQKLNLPEETSATLLSLGNTARLLEDWETAREFYQQAAATAVRPLTKLEAQINLLGLSIDTEQWQATEALLPQIQANLKNSSNTNVVSERDEPEISQPRESGLLLRRNASSVTDSYSIDNISASRPLVYALVSLAKNSIDLQANRSLASDMVNQIPNLLQQALQQAEDLKDKRAESYVLGTLGHYYEQQQQWQTSWQFTEQALNIAQTLNASDIAYQWQWQLGRLLQARGDKQGAIAPYTEAVNDLQSLRSSLVTVNPNAQLSFRQSVEPVYRELVGLLLDVNPNREQLQQAREVIESLQLAELENFFREACLDAEPRQIDEVDTTAAVIYPIILPDRLAVILSLPDRTLRHYATYLPQTEIEDTIANLYQSLNPVFSNQKRLQLSQKVYDWLLEPAEADLSKNGIKTLAFVLDGSLRNIPMAALFDGEQYAIEKYNIALTPGLQLLPSQGLPVEKLEAVVAGVSESNQGFSPLPGVREEVTEISARLSTQLLLDREFTNVNLQEQLQKTSAPIVHLATHGQFGSTPEDTFILTWKDRIKVNELESLLRSRETSRAEPIELMVLSACQTAQGDDRAALGMAGMAVRSGARSTIATLWSVKDRSTTRLIDEFYQQLVQSQSNVNKAEALRQAQLASIDSEDYNHPFYWSPFVLIGNWL